QEPAQHALLPDGPMPDLLRAEDSIRHMQVVDEQGEMVRRHGDHRGLVEVSGVDFEVDLIVDISHARTSPLRARTRGTRRWRTPPPRAPRAPTWRRPAYMRARSGGRSAPGTGTPPPAGTPGSIPS